MHHLTAVDPSQFVHKAFTADHAQELGWGQAVLAHLSPMGVTLPAPGADFNPEAGCTAIAAAAETALMTPTLDNNLDRVYYSFKTEFGMEAYLTQLHRGPLRTTLARFRLGQHWLHLQWHLLIGHCRSMVLGSVLVHGGQVLQGVHAKGLGHIGHD